MTLKNYDIKKIPYGMITRDDLMAHLDVSRTTLGRLCSEPGFPKAKIKVSKRYVYDIGEVDRHMAKKDTNKYGPRPAHYAPAHSSTIGNRPLVLASMFYKLIHAAKKNTGG